MGRGGIELIDWFRNGVRCGRGSSRGRGRDASELLRSMRVAMGGRALAVVVWTALTDAERERG